jgi:uncharacterized metal-binding protein
MQMTSSLAATFGPMLMLLFAIVGCAGVGRVAGAAAASASGDRGEAAGSTGANGGATADASVVDASRSGPGPYDGEPIRAAGAQEDPGAFAGQMTGARFA